MTEAPTSPLARLRASYAARQQADPARFVDLWPDGELVAQVTRSEDMGAARGIMRTLALIAAPEQAAEAAAAAGDLEPELEPEDVADVIAAATVSLHVRNSDDTLEAILTDAGTPLRFDQEYGKVIGVPDIATPRAAVFAAFTAPVVEDGPPELDALALLRAAMNVCNVLVTGRAVAQEVVGKASATKSDETPG